jgi:hypothetical protein
MKSIHKKSKEHNDNAAQKARVTKQNDTTKAKQQNPENLKNRNIKNRTTNKKLD